MICSNSGSRSINTRPCEDKAATAERQAFIKIMTDGAKELCECKTMECLDKANKKIQDAAAKQQPATAPK